MLSRIKSVLKKNKGDTFIGLIDENAVGKALFKEEYSMTFRLCAFIKNNEHLQEKEVVVYKRIPNFEYIIKGLEPLTIVEFTGEQISYHGQNRINLSSIIKTKTSHPELQKVLEKRLEPIIFKSEFFGNFLLDRRSNWFESKSMWLNEEIELFLSGDLSDIPELEKQAIQLFKEQSQWDLKFRNKIAKDLLTLRNENWIEEKENLLTEEEFIGKIKLENLVIHNEGDFEASYNDGDTFWGHCISIDGNLDGTLNEASIQG